MYFIILNQSDFLNPFDNGGPSIFEENISIVTRVLKNLNM